MLRVSVTGSGPVAVSHDERRVDRQIGVRGGGFQLLRWSADGEAWVLVCQGFPLAVVGAAECFPRGGQQVLSSLLLEPVARPPLVLGAIFRARHPLRLRDGSSLLGWRAGAAPRPTPPRPRQTSDLTRYWTAMPTTKRSSIQRRRRPIASHLCEAPDKRSFTCKKTLERARLADPPQHGKRVRPRSVLLRRHGDTLDVEQRDQRLRPSCSLARADAPSGAAAQQAGQVVRSGRRRAAPSTICGAPAIPSLTGTERSVVAVARAWPL